MIHARLATRYCAKRATPLPRPPPCHKKAQQIHGFENFVAQGQTSNRWEGNQPNIRESSSFFGKKLIICQSQTGKTDENSTFWKLFVLNQSSDSKALSPSTQHLIPVWKIHQLKRLEAFTIRQQPTPKSSATLLGMPSILVFHMFSGHLSRHFLHHPRQLEDV